MRGCVWAALLAFPVAAAAHQPVMDMAPRWQDGFGLQLRQEYRESNELRHDSHEVANPFERERVVATTWLEGIYTFRRELRATLKLPWVEQRRDVVEGGMLRRTRGSGIGDAVVAVPLRKYWNLSRSTMNIGLTPQLRVPTGSVHDDYPVGDGSWDFGLSTSLSAENVDWYGLVDVFWWKNTPGRRGIDEGDLVGFDGNLGYHVYHDDHSNTGVYVMLDAEVRYQGPGRDDRGSRTGGSRVTLGPILVGYWNNLMFRGELKVPVVERVFGTQLSRGILLNVGVGAAF